MTYIPPADKLLHASLGALVTLAALIFAGWAIALAACAVAAVGREVYGWRQRGSTMTRDNWVESALDAGATLGGGAVVLLAAMVGL